MTELERAIRRAARRRDNCVEDLRAAQAALDSLRSQYMTEGRSWGVSEQAMLHEIERRRVAETERKRA